LLFDLSNFGEVTATGDKGDIKDSSFTLAFSAMAEALLFDVNIVWDEGEAW
jgi:hypothetical protein